jgi:hypothetical protein
VVVAIPAKAGAVERNDGELRRFHLAAFTEFAAPASKGHASPVAFETWGVGNYDLSARTFSTKPHWLVSGEPMKLLRSVLEVMKTSRFGFQTMSVSPGSRFFRQRSRAGRLLVGPEIPPRTPRSVFASVLFQGREL